MSKFDILTINAHCPRSAPQTDSSKRRHAIQMSVIAQAPSVVFLQDFKWTKITGHAWKSYPIPNKFTFVGTKESAMLVDESEYISRSVNRQDLRRIIEYLQLSPFNSLGDRFLSDFDPLSRMCIRHIQNKSDRKLKLLCVSWHGKGKEMTNTSRRKDFKYLMEFFRHLRETFGLPVLVAGDFNVAAGVVEDLVRPPFRLFKYEPSPKRKKTGMRDFLVASEELELTDVSCVDINGLPGTEDAGCFFDHDPVIARVRVT